MFKSLSLTFKRHECLSQLRSLHHKVVTRPQTIYALSTSPGKAGVAVVRISGNNAKEVISLSIEMLLKLNI